MRWLAVVAAVAALFFVGAFEVNAQSYSGCSSYGNQCSQAKAKMLCDSAAAAAGSTPGYRFIACLHIPENSSSGRYSCTVQIAPNGAVQRCWQVVPGAQSEYLYSYALSCPSGQTENPYTGECQAQCSGRPSATTPFLPVTGSTQCYNGCVAVYSQNADETSTRSLTGAMCSNEDFKKNCPSGSYYNGYMGVCEPVDKPCPEGQKKEGGQCVPDGKCPDGMIAVQGTTPGAVQQGSLYCKPTENECPAGMIKSSSGQCLPGDGQCAAGEAKGKDGTCKRDSDNDGTPDSEEGEDDPNTDSASGGDSCDAPPTCNGNAIQCMQVKIQWRIDCNTRRQVNISGGTCDAVPICTGKGCNAMEYAQLMQQWRTTCAVEKLARKEGADNDASDANGNGVPDALEGIGDVTDAGDGQGDVAGAKRFGIGVSTSLLDQDNIFGGGSCPQPPTFKLMGSTVSGSDFPYWCQAMAILRGLVLIFGAFTALKILMGWGF